jgi:hypothetical protein
VINKSIKLKSENQAKLTTAIAFEWPCDLSSVFDSLSASHNARADVNRPMIFDESQVPEDQKGTCKPGMTPLQCVLHKAWLMSDGSPVEDPKVIKLLDLLFDPSLNNGVDVFLESKDVNGVDVFLSPFEFVKTTTSLPLWLSKHFWFHVHRNQVELFKIIANKTNFVAHVQVGDHEIDISLRASLLTQAVFHKHCSVTMTPRYWDFEFCQTDHHTYNNLFADIDHFKHDFTVSAQYPDAQWLPGLLVASDQSAMRMAIQEVANGNIEKEKDIPLLILYWVVTNKLPNEQRLWQKNRKSELEKLEGAAKKVGEEVQDVARVVVNKLDAGLEKVKKSFCD